ncbi:MAG TPA: hypothetical protein VL096_01255, partial [Pirellulaceae bacterium]|nr:hypothetical protein [Pirellulaceae bacterium]
MLCITFDGRLAQANPASQPLLVDWHTAEGQTVPEWLQQEVRATLQSGATRRLERACSQSCYALTLVPLPQHQLVNLYGHDITRLIDKTDGLHRHGIASLIDDVTERKRAEEHTHRLRDELAHVTRLGTLGELAAGLAHELSQP